MSKASRSMGDLAEGLHRVHVERDAVLAGDRADLRAGLDGPDLGVGVHDRDQDGVGPDGAPDVVGIDQPVAVDVEIGHLEALALERSGTPAAPRGARSAR